MSKGLDLAALRKMQGNLKNKAGKGDGLFIYSNKLPEDMDIRLLPTRENMNGIYFLEQSGWWINGNFYPVDQDNDVIDEEINAARETKDKTLVALIEKKKDGKPMIKHEFRYLLPILQLNCKYNDDEELVDYDVEGDAAKVLIAKPTLITAINEVVTSRPYQNKTQWGMMDRVKGFNMIIGKTGKGLNTEYRAIGWTQALEMDEKYYQEDKIPDILDINRKAVKSEEYLRSVIRNYLYGEDILEEGKDSDDDNSAEEKETPKASTGGAKRPSLGSARGTTKATASTAGKPKSRSLMGDVESELNDLDE